MSVEAAKAGRPKSAREAINLMLNDRSIPRISPPEPRGHATLAQIQNTTAHFNTVIK